jgi:hypothetical protein
MKANTRCVCVREREREREYGCVVWLIRRYKGMSCNWHIKKQELQVVEWNIVVSDEWWFWVLNPVSSEIPLTIYIYIDGAVNNEDNNDSLRRWVRWLAIDMHSTLLVVTCKHKAWKLFLLPTIKLNPSRWWEPNPARVNQCPIRSYYR